MGNQSIFLDSNSLKSPRDSQNLTIDQTVQILNAQKMNHLLMYLLLMPCINIPIEILSVTLCVFI